MTESARSLAVLTDAAHLLSDVSGFGVSLWAAWYATRRSQSTHTFGCASPLPASALVLGRLQPASWRPLGQLSSPMPCWCPSRELRATRHDENLELPHYAFGVQQP